MKINKIKPLCNRILVTADKYEDDIIENGIIRTTKGTLKEYQKVLAVGSTVRDIKVGDLVLINPIRYAVKKHREGSLKDGVITDNPVVSYNFNLVEVGDKVNILLYDSDIDYIIEDYEEDKPSMIIKPKTKKLIID